MKKIEIMFVDLLLKIYIETYFYLAKKYAKKIWLEISYSDIKELCMQDFSFYILNKQAYEWKN